MKFLFKFTQFVFLFVSAIFVTSCNKQDIATNAPSTVDVSQSQLKLKNVKFENGMLVFNTKADLDSAVALVNKNQDAKWVYNQFPQHVSHNSVFKALTKDELRLLDSSPTIPDKYKEIVQFAKFDSSRILLESISILPLSIFANQNGILGVGDEVIKIGSINTYNLSRDYYLANPNLDFAHVLSSTENVKIIPISSPVRFRGEQYFGETGYVEAYGGVPRRSALYLWKQEIRIQFGRFGRSRLYQQINCWGEYENFGCDGWFCHDYWRVDWWYYGTLSGTINIAVPNGFYQMNFSRYQGAGYAQVNVSDTEYSDNSDDVYIMSANVKLEYQDGSQNPHTLSLVR